MDQSSTIDYAKLAEEARTLPTYGSIALSDRKIANFFEQNKLAIVVALELAAEIQGHP